MELNVVSNKESWHVGIQQRFYDGMSKVRANAALYRDLLTETTCQTLACDVKSTRCFPFFLHRVICFLFLYCLNICFQLLLSLYVLKNIWD